jgi:membrane associated rhomboid family serine protease
MKYDILQVLGMILLALGTQGAIRQIADHGDAGLLAWLPGGFAVGVTAHILALVAGALLATWSHRAAKAAGRRG